MRASRPSLAVALALLAAPLAAQQDATARLAAPGDSLVLTLQEALRRAEPASEQVDIAEAGVRRARGARMQAFSALMPQVTLTPNYQRIINTPFDALFGDGGGIPGGDTGNPLTARNQWRFGGSATWTPINFAAYANVSAANAAIEQTRLQLSQQQAFTILTVASTYYNAVLSDQLLQIREATLEQAERTFKEIQLGYEVGTQSEFDALRARVAKDNQVPVVTRARADRDIALTQLKQLLDIPVAQPLTLTTSLDEATSTPTLPDTLRTVLGPADTTVDGRNVVQQAARQLSQAEAGYKAAGRQWLPAIGASLNYNRVGFGSDFNPGSASYFDDFNVGLAASWPIFTGGRILGARRVAAADRDVAELSLKLTREQAALDNVSVVARLREAEDNATSTQAVVEQAQRAYEIAELRFREGLSTQTELQDVRLQLENARANRAQSVRDLQVARLRLVLLPYLPIGTADPSIVNAGISSRQATASASGSITAPTAAATPARR
jgi:outer membrane protein TolC